MNCNFEYSSDILSIIEDFINYEDEKTLEALNEYVNEEIVSISDDIPKFSLSSYVENDSFKKSLQELLETYNIPMSTFNVDSGSIKIETKSNIATNLTSTGLVDLFHTLPLVKANFELKSASKILTSILIGKRTTDKYVGSDMERSNNIADLKNDLFVEIQEFLKTKNKLSGGIKNLYNENRDIVDYDHYTKVMNLLDDYFFKDNNYTLIDTYSGKKIPNLSMDINTNENIFNAYNAGILLSNFDSVIRTYFSGILDVDYNAFNNLRTNLGEDTKYKLKIEGIKTDYWLRDTHLAEGSESSENKLVKLLISTIPLYNKKGVQNGMFMEMKDFYLFAAQVSEFESRFGNKYKNLANSNFFYFNEDPKKALLWYTQKIAEAPKKKVSNEIYEIFGENYEFAISINNYFKASNLNLLKKEANSSTSLLGIFGQVVNNSFGASYLTYDNNGEYKVRDMYRQNFNSIQIQTSLFTKLAQTSNEKIYDSKLNQGTIVTKILKDLEGVENMKSISKAQKIRINNFLRNKTGIQLTYLGFDDFIDDLHKNRGSKIDYNTFLNLLNGLMGNLSSDYKIVINKIDSKEITKLSKGDSAVSKYIPNTINDPVFKGLKNANLLNHVMKSVMTIETLSGEKLPTFKLATLTQKDAELFQLQREFEQKNKESSFFKSLLIKNDAAIIGTGTKLELINNKVNKKAPEFNVSENFISDFQFDFLQNIIKNDKFSVMLGNYSDKNTILTKIVDAKFMLGKSSITITSIDETLEVVRTQSANYYKDTLYKLFKDYSKLLDVAFPQETKSINKNIQKLNAILREIDVRTLSLKASKLGINLTEDLHYSNYEGKYALNQLIVDNYRIFNNKNSFSKFVKMQEEKMLAKFKKYNKSIGGEEKIQFTGNFDVVEAVSKMKLDEELFDKKVSDSGEELEVYDYTKLEGKSGINPLLRKWMWTNALFRNEYMYVSGKGEYMHPHKMRDLKYRGNSDKIVWEELEKEMSGRIATMAKRNVIYTATIEVPIRKTQLGIPEDLNIAAIDDFTNDVYNIAGNTYKQDSHDGSSLMNYAYSKMIDNSYPAKGYEGTKKQFGTFITEHGVTLKKDAESVITNDKILNSTNSLINLRNKQEQMLNIPIGILDYNFDQSFDNEFFYNSSGTQYRIERLIIKDNNVSLVLSKKEEDHWVPLDNWIKKDFNSLYDLWELFGAEFSTNAEGRFNEGSNDLLYKVITSPDLKGNYPLKNKMIHVLSNLTSLKAGGTNVNSNEMWVSKGDLAFTTYKNRFLGIQLDASHKADESEIKEITQVISALAQNPATAYLAEETYKDIASVIERAMTPYLKYLKPGEKIDKSELYKYIAQRFVKTIESSKGDNIAKVLIQSFSEDVNIPFSNQNFFVPFVRDIITKMNNEFITRHYSGTGAVLLPSHGIIQIYDIPQENGTVRIASQKDLIREALSIPGQTGTNREIIQNYINEKLPNIDVNWDQIQLGDTIQYETISQPLPEAIELLNISKDLQKASKKLLKEYYEDPKEFTLASQQLVSRYLKWNYKEGPIPTEIDISNFTDFLQDDFLGREEGIDTDIKQVTLSTPELYYTYKGNKTFEQITKVQNVPRDLKPSGIEYIDNGVRKNLFDLDSVKLRFELSKIVQNINKGEEVDSTNPNFILLSQFANYFGVKDLVGALNRDLKGVSQNLSSLLNKWTQRNLDLLEYKLVMNPVKDGDFKTLFGGERLQYIFKDVKHLYNDANTHSIEGYKFFPAELILGDLYQSKLKRDFNDSLYQIKEQGASYFRNKLESDFEEDHAEADLKINLKDFDRPIYIKYVDKLPANDHSIKLTLEEVLEDSVKKAFVRRNEQGEIMYSFDSYDNTRVKMVDGKETIFIKALATKQEKEGTLYNREEDFSKNLNNIIKSFGNNIASVIPLMNGSFGEYKLNPKDKNKLGTFNSITLNIFTNFVGYNTKFTYLNKKWLAKNKEDILNQLSKKMYVSWEKSHEFIAARIPAQSMQSFMPMKNIAYLDTKSNDAYVSIWQIWLQGSDFDIDKAYILGSGFNENGQYDSWSALSTYSTIEQLDALEKLPLPTGQKVVEIEIKAVNNVNLTKDYEEFIKAYGNLNEVLQLRELSVRQLEIINNVLRKLLSVPKKYKEIPVFINSPHTKLRKIFLSTINKHNLSKSYLHQNHAIKNSVVAKIKQIMASPTNQILANSPVSIQNLRDAVEEVSKGNTPEYLSSYDMFSMYKQQKDASVGKQDVGISANGLKVFYALSSYYNNYYNNNFNSNKEVIRRDNTTFKKEFKIIDAEGKTFLYNLAAIADIGISKDQELAIRNSVGDFKVLRTNAALTLSEFTSAATDNAKELLMAKMNANIELASMHIYLMMMGFTPKEMVTIMTLPTIEEIINRLDVNIFFEDSAPTVGMIFEDLISEYKDDPILLQNTLTLKDIFDGAQEAKLLASFLGANQKTSANTEEIFKYLTKFETAIYARENHIFGQSTKDFKSWIEFSDSLDIIKADKAKKIFEKIVATIFKNNKQLDPTKDKKYVEDILKEAKNIKVFYTNTKGERESKYVSILGGQFNFKYYVDNDPENDNYRKITKKYYNLIKNTINIFDVIDQVPHFKAMIAGVNLAHNLLSNATQKYDSIFTITKDTIRDQFYRIYSKERNPHIKHQMGNTSFFPLIDTKIVQKSLVGNDVRLRTKWLRSEGTSDLVFNVTQTIKLLNKINKDLGKDEISDYLIYTSDEARNESNIKNNSKLVNETDTSDTIISLNTHHGIANFKKFMEEILLPLLQSKSNILTDSFAVQNTYNVWGIRTGGIMSSFPLSSINNAVALDRSQKLIKAFNELDVLPDTKNLVKNANNKVLKWRDLFYVYNLLLNNDTYGDKRLTPLFEDYSKETSSLGHDYITYSAQVDSGKVNLYDLEEELLNNPEYQRALENNDTNSQKELIKRTKEELDNDLLFYALNTGGKLSVKTYKGWETLSVTNGDFLTISSITESPEIKKGFADLHEIIQLIKNRGFIIKFEC